MIAVIFEVWPSPGQRESYLNWAAEQRAEVEKIPGFISVERFESLYEEGKMMSFQFWKGEESISTLRYQLDHQRAMAAGRGGMFSNYRLRVATVVRDDGHMERTQSPS